TWLEDGCPTYFVLGAFQFLPAFFTSILRQAARGSLRPLHHFSWSFHVTDAQCPRTPHLLPAVTFESESSMTISNSKSEECDITEKGTEEEEAFEKEEYIAEEEQEFTNPSIETEEEEEESEKPILALNSKESTEKWHQLGQDGPLVSGLWLVGASWNSEQ
ncbi:hypothetical protein SK128_018228, partial [Halocaridina rubra]